MNTMEQERRRDGREPVTVCAWLEFGREEAIQGTVSLDLSNGGARFASVALARIGQPVLVRLQLEPCLEAIECKGRVCWSRIMADGQNHFGVRFVDLHHEEQERLACFLAARSQSIALATV